MVLCSIKKNRNLGSPLAGNHWGVDSMASLHISGNRDQLVSLSRCSPIQVEVADGTYVTAQYKGSVRLKVKLINISEEVIIPIEDVYYNERFSANLLSWGAYVYLTGSIIVPRKEPISSRQEGIKFNLKRMDVCQ